MGDWRRNWLRPDRIAGFLVALLLVGSAWGSEPERPDAATLRRHGISPDSAGVVTFLNNLTPSAELRRRIDDLIVRLGNDDFQERESASRELSGIGAARPALLEATRSDDAEVSHRARRILDMAGDEQEALLLAVLRLIRIEKLPGTAAQLLRTIPLCTKEYVRRTAAEALAAAARPEDLPLLKAAIASENSEVRVAAIIALERAAGEPAVEILRPLLKNDDDTTRLAAAEALINRRPRDCMSVLSALLESDRPQVRIRSERILHLLTGQRFGFFGESEDAATRTASVASWRKWLAGPGRLAKLHVPLPTVAAPLGRTLVCVLGGGRHIGQGVPGLLELDEHDNQKMLADGTGRTVMPFGCQGLPDGHRLYTDWHSHSVVELDEMGKEVWRKTVAGGPASVERLDNGNTLVAVYQGRMLVELTPDGRVAWQREVAGSPSDARTLENGNLLVVLSDQGSVVEMDRAGRQVSKFDGLPNPWSARRLSSGNTLVACYGQGKVVELSPDGKTVWSVEGVPSCYDAVPLENGHILIGYFAGLREVDRRGTVIKERPVGMVRRISVY